MKKDSSRLKNLITVGDLVYFEKEGEKKGSIVSISERCSLLARQDPFYKNKKQLIAANLDQVFITTSIADPPLQPFVIDRYMIATFKGNMKPVLVINKIDLLEKGSPLDQQVRELVKLYLDHELLVLLVSVKEDRGIDEIKKAMQDKASVFVGESGVGKSSLINAVTGKELFTQEVGKKSKRGVHTTTRAELISLSFGGFCIDTPGIQMFGLTKLSREDLNSYFSEIHTRGLKCRFQDCTHRHEPHCHVKEALQENKILKVRYESYLKLLEESF